jgi:hypothetical protein
MLSTTTISPGVTPGYGKEVTGARLWKTVGKTIL